MTRLYAVPPEGQHSVRVDQTTDDLADLEAVCLKVLGPAELAVRELRAAMTARDRVRAVPALRRLVAVGGLAKSWADRLAGEQT